MKKLLFFISFVWGGVCPSILAQDIKNGVFLDERDGKKYRTVQIGNLIWFADDMAFESDSAVQTKLYVTRRKLLHAGRQQDGADKKNTSDSILVKSQRSSYEDAYKNRGDISDAKVVRKKNKNFIPERRKQVGQSSVEGLQGYNAPVSSGVISNMTHYEDVVVDSVFITFYKWEDAVRVCPKGWRLPTDDDWKDLEKAIGMNEYVLDKEGFRGTDEAKNIKFGGRTKLDFYLLGTVTTESEEFGRDVLGFWWTSTFDLRNFACYRALVNYNNMIGRMFGSMNRKYCVRCVKDVN